jgi:hypothetical protein
MLALAIIAVTAIVASYASASTGNGALDVVINKVDGSYSINVDGNIWLKSGNTYHHSTLTH